MIRAGRRTRAEENTLHFGQDVLLHDLTCRDHAVVAGVGYGKSDFGPKWLEYRRLFVNPKSQYFLITAPTYRLLKKVCFAKYVSFLTDVCEMRQGRGKAADFSVNWADMVIAFRTGQEVLGVSTTDPNSNVGYTVADAWLDECALSDPETRRRVIKRLRCPNARKRQILHSTTPEGMNWLYDVFNPEKCPREGVFSRGPNRLVLHGSSHDNPYLDEEYLQGLEDEFGWDERYYQNYVLGWWVSLLRNAFYFAFDEQRNVGDYKLDHRLPEMILTFDFNVGKMAWAVIQRYGREYRVVHANRCNGRNADDACEQFIADFPPQKYRNWEINVLGDATGYSRSPSSYETPFDVIEAKLKAHYPHTNIRAHRKNPFVEERSRVTNRMLKETRLVIDRSCVKIIESAKTAETDRRTGIKKTANDKDMTHPMEAIDMALMVLEPPTHRLGSYGVVW